LVPSRAIDGDTRNASRWSGNGSSEELVLDLGTDRDITDVQIAWFLGSSGDRSFIFELDARSSLTNEWTTIFSGESSGATDAFENYNVDDITASELRIRSLSNSDGTTSTAIREVTISGIAEETAPEGKHRRAAAGAQLHQMIRRLMILMPKTQILKTRPQAAARHLSQRRAILASIQI